MSSNLGKKAYTKLVDPQILEQLRPAFGLSSYYKVFHNWVVDYDEKTKALKTLLCQRRWLSPVSNEEFGQLKREIASKYGQSTKTLVVLDAVKRYHFTTDQVAELMQKLSWDSDRLKVAKSAYVKTLDVADFSCLIWFKSAPENLPAILLAGRFPFRNGEIFNRSGRRQNKCPTIWLPLG